MVERHLLPWLVLACAPACTGEVGEPGTQLPIPPPVQIVEEARVAARVGAAAVALVDLGGDSPDLLVANPARFEVDVLALDPESAEWSLVASAFSGADGASELVGARVGGRPVVLARLGDKEVTLLAGVTGDPHRLRFPISVYRNRGALSDIDAADIDGDGDDELVVAGQQGVAVVELVPALDAHPEQPPSLGATETWVEAQIEVAAVAVADVEGDGALEIVAALEGEARARIYRPDDTGTYAMTELGLDAPSNSIAGTACRGRGAVLGLDGGGFRQLAASAGGYELVPAAPARRLVTGGARLATLAPDGATIAIRAPCGPALAELSLGVERADDLALADLGQGEQQLARLDTVAGEVALYRLFDTP